MSPAQQNPEQEDGNGETNASNAIIEEGGHDIIYDDNEAEAVSSSQKDDKEVTSQVEDTVTPKLRERIGGFFKAIPMFIGIALFLLIGALRISAVSARLSYVFPAGDSDRLRFMAQQRPWSSVTREA